MPELPEVELHRRELTQLLGSNPLLESFELQRKDVRFPLRRKDFASLCGQTLRTVDRRAKYLLFRFEQGTLLSSLGMTGRWRFSTTLQKHDHIVLQFTGLQPLVFSDPRRFGFVEIAHPEKFLLDLGPEPLDSSWTAEVLHQNLRRRSGPIKPLLMNQSLVVGVGNIYASEALHLARIHPQKSARRISLQSCERLVHSVRAVLQKALAEGGSSIRTYRTPSGARGQFQHTFQVYDRALEPCFVCGTRVRKLVQAGRSTFFCPHCQK